MKAVRYYSRSGNTKMVAEAIAEAVGAAAVAVDSPEAAVTEEVDVLFLGAAVYAHGIDRKMKDFLAALDGAKVKKAVLFSTSMMSKHALELMKRALQEKGVEVAEETFYVKSKAVKNQLGEAAEFARIFA